MTALQADVFLPLDDLFDLAVFDRFERRGVDFAALALGARVLQRRGAQQAADMIGAEGGRGRCIRAFSSLLCPRSGDPVA